jgi:hypothetical protein
VVASIWKLTFFIWGDRNKILLAAQENHHDIDPGVIDLAILEEWTISADPSWDKGSQSLFLSITCEALLSKHLHQRCQWLHYVQLARSTPLPSPFFATDGSEL